MKSATLLCSAAMAAVWMATPAAAADGQAGFSSSASATLTVIIPPLQAGFDASAEGAVGLWTLAPGNAALMVKIPDSVPVGQSAGLDVFRANGNVFDVSVPASTGFHLSQSASSQNKGLLRQSYLLSSNGAMRHDPLQVVIRGI